MVNMLKEKFLINKNYLEFDFISLPFYLNL